MKSGADGKVILAPGTFAAQTEAHQPQRGHVAQDLIIQMPNSGWLEPAALVGGVLLAAISAGLSYWSVRTAKRSDAKKHTIDALHSIQVARAELNRLTTIFERQAMLFADWTKETDSPRLQAYAAYLNTNEIVAAALHAGVLDAKIMKAVDLNHGADLPYVRDIVRAMTAQGRGDGLYEEYIAYLEQVWNTLPATKRELVTRQHAEARQSMAISISMGDGRLIAIPTSRGLVEAQLEAEPPKEYRDLLEAAEADEDIGTR